MKGLKKLALVTAVAAAPFAQAEMTAMDDALLGEMTGQAGITIDVDLQMTIDAIKYVDSDGNAGGSAEQGAITLKGLSIGSIGTDPSTGLATLDAATIRGVTIDADGTDGLVIGLNQIGDELGNGIDITVDAFLINDGSANLASVNAVNAATFNVIAGGNYDQFKNGTVTGQIVVAAAAKATTLAAGMTDAQAAAIGFTDAATLDGAIKSADPATQAKAVLAVTGFAGQALTNNGGPTGNPAVDALAGEAEDLGTAQGVGAVIASAGNGNVGGIKIEDFRNYIEDDLVTKYNGVFDMALMDSEGNLTGGDPTKGRFVRGEIVVNGTGNYTGDAATTTGGLKISGEFGGAMDKAAWVDNNGGEFGIADIGFFHGVDTDGDTIADTIEGMHFSVNIDVEDRESSIAGVDIKGNAFAKGTTVAALKISDMQLQGTIMLGQIYVGNEAGTQATSLGSVLIKDIDMTGTSVWVYGH